MDKPESAIQAVAAKERDRLLDPIDRISEILFGLIMAVTIVGSISVATAGHEDLHSIMIAALGCNLAWGLVDAVMYLIRTATERSRNRALSRRIVDADLDSAHRLIVGVLPDHVAALAGPDEIEGMRRRLLGLKLHERATLQPRDYLEAAGIFLLVVIATFPVVLPFLLMNDAVRALRVSQAVTLAMLFMAGFALGRHAEHAKPILTGVLMAVFGAVLIGVVKALGG